MVDEAEDQPDKTDKGSDFNERLGKICMADPNRHAEAVICSVFGVHYSPIE